MSESEIAINIIISYFVICGVISIGAAIGLFLKWLERILD
jgi:hypothetical protein